uniref:Bestrophin homolog n=1 Tax=Ascaris lumbricoides TaxID=6252 RepID=A0A0M3IKD3_ASCLU
MLCNYDWVPIPLAYPQLVFLAVYVYFALCLISRQFIITERDAPNKSTLVFLAVYVYFALCLISRQFIITERDAPNKSSIDLTLPFMTMMEFLILVGWMKVAEGLLNPFGEDDDDFECNFLLDKNLATALCIVDDASNDAPKLEKDRFWHSDEVEPMYSKETASQPINPLVGSATQAQGAQNRPRVVGMSKLFYSDVAINELEDGTQAESISQKRNNAKSSKYFSRQVSAFTVLDGHSSQGINGELLLHRGLPEISIHRPSSLCSSRTPSNADSQKSISLMNILSTVEEEDPTNLTVHQQEDSRRGAICEVQSTYASLMDKSKDINAEKVDESAEVLKNTSVELPEKENKELLEKTSEELSGKASEELSGKGSEELLRKSSEELPMTATEKLPVKTSEESPENTSGSLAGTSHRKARRLAFVNAAFNSTVEDLSDV